RWPARSAPMRLRGGAANSISPSYPAQSAAGTRRNMRCCAPTTGKPCRGGALSKSPRPLATLLQYISAMQKVKLPELSRMDQDPASGAAWRELRALKHRLAEPQPRRQRARARLRGAAPASSPLERAKKLLAGGHIGAIDPADDVKACDEEEFQI